MKLSHTCSNGHVLFRLQDDGGLDVGELRISGASTEDLGLAREAVSGMEAIGFYLEGLLDALKGTVARPPIKPKVDSVTLTAYIRHPEAYGRGVSMVSDPDLRGRR